METGPFDQTYHARLTIANNELFETLQKRLFKNTEKDKLFYNREQLAHATKSPSDGEFNVIDAIITTYFDNLKHVHDVTFDDINTVIYFATVTIR